ncbi:MAG TPA: hypothetical protein VNG32_05170 [Candidatus Dormibacteraeota bacterium]|nr:hypothetical protein [Candidatus Dormibacteraeota bacterium]
MKSKWFDKKEDALRLRTNGVSIRTIEKSLGIPRSTLSNWFKNVELAPVHTARLAQNRTLALIEARKLASAWHREQKQKRLLAAEAAAHEVMEQIQISQPILDLSLAMLYLGEGAKGKTASISSSSPMILKFVLAVLKKNYNIKPSAIRCELHLRADQDARELKTYWSQQLQIPITNFGYVAYDKRTAGRATYSTYKGVCVLLHGVAIQRKLMYLYNTFCQQVIDEAGD